MNFDLDSEFKKLGITTQVNYPKIFVFTSGNCKYTENNNRNNVILAIDSLQSILFSPLFLSEIGKENIKKGEWKKLEDTEVEKLPLCVYNVFWNCQKENREITKGEVKQIASTITLIVNKLKEMIQPSNNNNTPSTSAEELENSDCLTHIPKNIKEKDFPKIKSVIQHYSVLGNDQDLLLLISKRFFEQLFPSVKIKRPLSRRISDLKLQMLPQVQKKKTPGSSANMEVKEIVSADQIKPKLKRGSSFSERRKISRFNPKNTLEKKPVVEQKIEEEIVPENSSIVTACCNYILGYFGWSTT